jgi:hypothetical protein
VTSTTGYVVPLLFTGAPNTAPPAVLRVSVDNRARLEEALKRDEFQGTIINSVSSLDSDTTNMLRRQFPNADISKVYIVEYGKAPWSPALVTTLLVLGIIGIVLALAMWLIMLLYNTY